MDQLQTAGLRVCGITIGVSLFRHAFYMHLPDSC